MKRALLALLFLASGAQAQTIIQSGPWTPGHLPAYYPMGSGSSVPLVIDAGPAGGGGSVTQGVSEMLMIQPTSPTGTSRSNWCDYSANPMTAVGGYYGLCLSPNDGAGHGVIAYNAYGGATPLPLVAIINGVQTQIGGGSAGTIAFPATVTGGTSGGVPYFSATTTLSSSAALAANAIVLGGGAGSAPATTTTDSSVVTAVAHATNANLGLATVSGSITTNDCLIWGPGVKDAGSAGCPASLTVGTSPIASGTNGYILYNNSGVLGNLPVTGTAGNVVLSASPALVTPNLGTPSIAVLTNATGLPISSGVTGLGTNVATHLGGASNVSGGFASLNGTPTAGHIIVWSASGLQDGGSGGATITVGSTPTSGGVAGQIMFDTGSVLNESPALVFTSPALQIVSNTASLQMGTGQDTNLVREGAGSLSQRNGTNAQLHCVYNTFTSSSNYEAGCLDWQTTTNTLLIGTEKGASGSARNLELVVGGVNKADYGVTTAGTWTFSGNFTGSLIGTSSAPTVTPAGGSCAGATTAGSTGTVGTILLSGACAATNTIAFTVMPTVPHGYVCFAGDRTAAATLVTQSASTTTGMTLIFSGSTSGATDVIQYSCTGF